MFSKNHYGLNEVWLRVNLAFSSLTILLIPAQQSDLRYLKLRNVFESLRKLKCSEVFQSAKVNPHFTQREQDIPWR